MCAELNALSVTGEIRQTMLEPPSRQCAQPHTSRIKVVMYAVRTGRALVTTVPSSQLGNNWVSVAWILLVLGVDVHRACFSTW